MEPQKTQNRKALLTKKKAGGITLPDFKIHYKSIVIKTVLHWHKNRHVDQLSRKNREPRNKTTHIGQLIYNKGAKNI